MNMFIRAALALCILATVSACQTSGGKEVKNTSGGTHVVSEDVETRDFEFNVPIFLKRINRVTQRHVNNGQQINESYYIDKSLVARSQYVRYGGYNDSTTSSYFEEDDFLDYLKETSFYKSKLTGAKIFKFTWGQDIALYAHKGSCYWLRLARVLEGASQFNKTGRKNLLTEIVSCLPLTRSPEQILQELDFATPSDHAEFMRRKEG